MAHFYAKESLMFVNPRSLYFISNNAFFFSENMPDAIETDCSKCSEKQRQGSEVMMRYLIDNKPEYWNPLQEKYDPTGSYKQRYLESKKVEVAVEPVDKSSE